MSSAFEEKKTGDGGDDDQRHDTGGRLSFAPEALLSAPPPLYTHLTVVFKSLKVIIRKKMFSGDTCQKETAYGCASTALFFLQQLVLEVCSTTRALESGNF